MAEAIASSIPNEMVYKDQLQCLSYPSFLNYGWENMYKKYMTSVIKVLNVHPDVSRLYLLIRLETSKNSVSDTVNRLNHSIINPHPEAIQLRTHLKDIMPDADPIYLDIVGELHAFDHQNLCEFIEEITTKKKTYPKLKEYNEHVKFVNTLNCLTENFEVKEFLRMCPNPVDYFKHFDKNNYQKYYYEKISYLSDRFPLIPMQNIRTAFLGNHCMLTPAVESLKTEPARLKNKRKTLANRIDYKLTENIEFLKEIAYVDHKDEILNYIETEKTNRQLKFEEAKSIGQLCTCECCFNDELLSTEVHSCPAGHFFCSPCIKKGIEVAVGASKMDFRCFGECNEEFELSMVKEIVDDKLYQRIMRLKQVQEIKAAGIEDLETCAFCDYSVILPPDLKTISCLNPECKKETCRECREESHVPYRCDQVEKAPEVQVRTMIENKMTEVLIRTCYNCKRKFVKEDGCNKMTCSCGKQMCYICRKPVDANYAHFYHTTVLENKCPLYTDENIVHSTAVEAAARLIIKELKDEQPELLRNINIDKILPELKKTKVQGTHVSALDVNKVVATVIGQNVEDVNNLKDMRLLGPKPKKARH